MGAELQKWHFVCLDDKNTSTPIHQIMPTVLKAFDTIREAKVSENSVEAKKLGFLRESESNHIQ